MKRTLTGLVGVLLILAGLAGLGFCVAGIIVLAQIEGTVEAAVMEQLALMDRTLAATTEGLEVAAATLNQAAAATAALEGMVFGLGEALEGTGSTVDAVADLVGEELPDTISATQRTLAGLAQTAELVDDALLLVSSIPLLGLERYEPGVPLSRGVETVVSSLEGIPDVLGRAQAGLVTTSGSLEAAQTDISVMGSELGKAATSLQTARAIIDEYLDVVAELQAMVGNVRTSFPNWLLWARIGLSLILVWLGIAQFGLITQGWELLARSRRSTV